MTDSIDPRTVAALADVDAATTVVDDHEIVLSNGTVLMTKAVPPMVFAKIQERFVEPSIPTVYDENSDRHIPNPDDPQYEKDLNDYRMKKGNAMIDAYIALGTELVSTTLEHPEGEEWVENLDFLEIDVPKLRTGRWLAWVKYVAATSTEDYQKIASKMASSLGITETEVANSIARFQDTEERATDSSS